MVVVEVCRRRWMTETCGDGKSRRRRRGRWERRRDIVCLQLSRFVEVGKRKSGELGAFD